MKATVQPDASHDALKMSQDIQGFPKKSEKINTVTVGQNQMI